MSTTLDRPATASPEVVARLVAVLAKLPTTPKTRAGIVAALAPAVTALITEATADTVTPPTPEGEQ